MIETDDSHQAVGGLTGGYVSLLSETKQTTTTVALAISV